MVRRLALIDQDAILRPSLRRMNADQVKRFFGNLSYRRTAGRGLARLRELRARAAGKRFYCAALSGESAYNISINADLSVSCNCEDIYGEGRLGSLDGQTFREVFGGANATRLRSELAEGKLPLTKCVTCQELRTTSAVDAKRRVTDYELPRRGLMLENNAGCNLSCVGCGRALRPLRSLKMRIEDLKRIAGELGDMGVRQIAFFSLGEPFMSRNVLAEMQALREAAPACRIFTSTNGVLVDTDDKREAALLMDEVVFSVDGCSQETLTRYQVGSDFERAFENMCRLTALRDARGGQKTRIVWKYVVFDWNDREHHLAQTLHLAHRAGVDKLEFVFTLNPYYGVSRRFLLSPYWRRFAPLEHKRRIRILRE